MEAARHLVRISPSFVTAMPSVAVAEDVGAGTLVTLAEAPDSLPVFAVRRQGPDSPGVEALWQTLIRKA
jgi:hypothetical protein